MSLSTTQYGYIVDPMVPFTDDKGKTIKNGFIRVFIAGTSTPVLTYCNYDGATNQEKIELDNSGRVKHNVIGSKGSLYKVVVYNILHSQENPLLTVDKIAVLGASINASGATIVTGLDSVTVQEENFLKATVEGTGVELALDPTEVTSDVNTISAAETAAPDYVLPLLDKTGTGDSKKISLANLFKFALDWISRLATTVTSFASGDFIAVSNTTNGARKMSKDTLLELTAQNALAGNVAPEFVPNVTEAKTGRPYMYGGNVVVAKEDYKGPWDASKFAQLPLSELIEELFKVDENYKAFGTIFEDVSAKIHPWKIIVTNVGVGNTIDVQNPSSNGSFGYYLLSVTEGQFIEVKGSGGNLPRLWCFTDSSYKVVSVANSDANTSGSYLRLAAPCDGYLIVNVDITGGQNVYGVNIQRTIESLSGEVVSNRFYFTDNSLVYKDSMSEVVKGKFIPTNFAVGNTVDVTDIRNNSSTNYVLKACNKGDSFYVRGEGGSVGRLWCFTDSDYRVVSVAAASVAFATPERLVAPCDGYIILNLGPGSHDYGWLVFETVISANINNRAIWTQFDLIHAFNDYFKGATITKGGYITTNVGVGNTVNVNSITYNGAYGRCVLPAVAGQKFKVLGNGAGAPRLWCFTDSSYKVVSVADSDASTGGNYIVVTAPIDGYAIFNFIVNDSNSTYGLKAQANSVDEIEYLDEFTARTWEHFKEYSLTYKSIKNTITYTKYITTNVGVGNVVDVEHPNTNSSFSYAINECKKGDTFRIRGNGGNLPRLWCFTDSSYRVVSVADSDAQMPTTTVIEAPCDGYLIVNMNWGNNTVDWLVLDSLIPVDERFSSIDGRVTSLEKACMIEMPINMKKCDNVDSYMEGLVFSQAGMVESVYAKFDALVEDYPDLVEKIDPVSITGQEYPEYANGVSGSETYLDTPAYKCWMYKISKSYVGAGNQSYFPKKKLLIIAGLHGMEIASVGNSYLFAKRLCAEIEDDCFALLSLCDVYVLPCLNAYGIYHGQRPNANDVDINRNFNVKGWRENGSKELGTWSGTTPDSEFETLLVEGLVNSLCVNFLVDHHNYNVGVADQFYTETKNPEILFASYNALNDISFFCVKNFPQYFGSEFMLVKGSSYESSLPQGLATTPGTSFQWMQEHGKFGVTLEIGRCINYDDGESGATVDLYGSETFTIGEFTLRNQLARYLNAIVRLI